MENAKILVTGANGQLGTEISAALADRYGSRNIITTDIIPKESTKSHKFTIWLLHFPWWQKKIPAGPGN
ncbi:hypothetical protein HRG_014436 [Hirsutella rhossiliensis]